MLWGRDQPSLRGMALGAAVFEENDRCEVFRPAADAHWI